MLSRGVGTFWRSFLCGRKLVTATAVLAYTLFKTHSFLNAASDISRAKINDKEKFRKRIDGYMKDLRTVEVCKSVEIPEGRHIIVQVKDIAGRTRKIAIYRLKGKLYALLANCSHREPL